MQIHAWYKSEERNLGAVRTQVEPVLRRNGFVLAPWSGTPSADISSWDQVTLEDQPIWYSLTRRTEGHVVFELASRKPQVNLAPIFLRAFSELLANRTLVLNECILSTANMDEYPFFTHSLGGTLNIVKMRKDGSIEAQRKAGDSDYWKEAGSKLHFVAAYLFEDPRLPSPQDWSARIRAPILKSPHGPIFDCGWSQLFPTLAPTFNG
ncbi:hypothetical protein [Vitiosangium sp. GDMCC 1.1324]|uniref:hypothetical protein n=1 Tax=Vitiosangium sp. (strain GDMCC 1.1324) TaxID=2138576 RepID=UPI000D3501E2|nr:hypothetical protein [Vitiosangium sp. GDMCC 1.1324]PTL76757.1 hypothetical protein DAT35_48385 [Vitiosangium sp. GDMCC 1.1324]